MSRKTTRQGQRINDKKREEIRAYYASCGNKSETARKFNVAVSSVHKIVNEKADDVEELRKQKKKEYIDEAWKVINLYMEHVQDPKVIKRTSARDSAILIGTLHDKMLKEKELQLKREELELKRQELEEPTENRVIIVNDKEAMRKALEDADG